MPVETDTECRHQSCGCKIIDPYWCETQLFRMWVGLERAKKKIQRQPTCKPLSYKSWLTLDSLEPPGPFPYPYIWHNQLDCSIRVSVLIVHPFIPSFRDILPECFYEIIHVHTSPLLCIYVSMKPQLPFFPTGLSDCSDNRVDRAQDLQSVKTMYVVLRTTKF